MTAAPVQLFAMGERGSCLQIPKNHAPRASLRPAHSANAASNVVLASTPEIHAEASQLTPVRLRRSAPGGGCLLTAGGGHVVGVEGRDAVVTRVDDGFFWRVPPRVGFEWGRPLYVDAVELALVELPTDETALAYGVYGEAWTIVRRTIASLGKPQPPEP
jgi:hypothetical protein